MPGVVDTNILLYAANADTPEHEYAAAFLNEAGRSPDQWYLTDGICYEFLRVATHAKVFPQPLEWREALDFLTPLLESARFHVIVAGAEHWTVLQDVLSDLTYPAGNLFFDVRTATLMREHGIKRIYTTDTDFLQFGEIEVVNPLKD
ncbi:MAG: PIN domain-containing protein [Gemmatimonadota bacterium]|nr:MAG: PIN domain-containing protein [Gemmatimonadota bacterium]